MKEEIIQRGQTAERLLQEPVLKEAIEGMKKEAVAIWAAVPTKDVEERERVWRYYKVVERFETLLKEYVHTGRFELHEKTLKEKASNIVRRWVA